ncbi:hypothetical protein Ancab_032663, partial [Ancistrocladus abbreviatus]
NNGLSCLYGKSDVAVSLSLFWCWLLGEEDTLAVCGLLSAEGVGAAPATSPVPSQGMLKST